VPEAIEGVPSTYTIKRKEGATGKISKDGRYDARVAPSLSLETYLDMRKERPAQ
jgi:hypothetical protein